MLKKFMTVLKKTHEMENVFVEYDTKLISVLKKEKGGKKVNKI
jgi:hypothetical protein